MRFQGIAEQLGKTGLCVWPAFLSPALLVAVRSDLQGIQENHEFHRAGTGKGSSKSGGDGVRRDETFWLERAASNPVQSQLWGLLDQLKQALNRTLFLGITDFEGHYAAYPAGGFYKRHLDTFRQDDARIVSFVLYLNEAWIPAQGGQLRVYSADEFTDVQPDGGTLACFLSRESEHEVLPCYATRLSFTGWFKV